MTDLLGKLRWFGSDVAPRSLQPFDLYPDRAGAAAVLAFVVVGFLLRGRTARWTDRLGTTILAVAVLPVSYGVNLAVADNWPAARTRLGLDIAVVVLVALACQGYAQVLEPVVPRWLALGTASSVVACLVVVAAYRSDAYFVAPQAFEYELARREIARTAVSASEPLYIVRSDWFDSSAPAVVLDEHGLPSTSASWVPSALVALELARHGRELPASFVVVAPEDREDVPVGAAVIDFDRLLDPPETLQP